MSTVPASLRALLSDLIDYAGLFPPAGLDMQTAVANYARYLRSEHAWMLGRFVLPAARLAEFEQAMPEKQPQPWRLSVLLGPKLEDDNVAVREFGPRCSKLAVIDCVETKVASIDQIEKLHRMIGSSITIYYETPLTPEFSKLLDAIKNANGRAKLRTGGVTVDAFPSSEAITNLLVECARRELPFKATAGLHHPIRCVKPLTYEPSAPTGTMHGFLNLFLVAISCYGESEPDRELISGLLGAEDPDLRFDDQCASIAATIHADESLREHGRTEIPTHVLRVARQNFAISFGSCSFEEPIADLQALNLL